MLKTEDLGKKKICIYETYKNTVIPHGCHIYTKAYDRLLQVSVRELHNNLVSAKKYGGLKEARYEYDKIIISDST